jgi:hypothetical protein
MVKDLYQNLPSLETGSKSWNPENQQGLGVSMKNRLMRRGCFESRISLSLMLSYCRFKYLSGT